MRRMKMIWMWLPNNLRVCHSSSITCNKKNTSKTFCKSAIERGYGHGLFFLGLILTGCNHVFDINPATLCKTKVVSDSICKFSHLVSHALQSNNPQCWCQWWAYASFFLVDDENELEIDCMIWHWNILVSIHQAAAQWKNHSFYQISPQFLRIVARTVFLLQLLIYHATYCQQTNHKCAFGKRRRYCEFDMRNRSCFNHNVNLWNLKPPRTVAFLT